MRRMCFDTASNYHRHFTDPYLNTPDDTRAFFRARYGEVLPRFLRATVFDSSTKRYRDFTDYRKLFDFLITADELISFNGRIWDLVILEKLVGEDSAQQLRQKPHYDLMGMRNKSGLRSNINESLPNRALIFEKVETDRLEKIRHRFDLDTAMSLANTYRDTMFTYMLFREYERCGRLQPPKISPI